MTDTMGKYVYIQSESAPENPAGLWTVGFYKPDGKWVPESDHASPDKAANRVAWLNGIKQEEPFGNDAEILDWLEREHAFCAYYGARDGFKVSWANGEIIAPTLREAVEKAAGESK